jgi:hypothetical protein
MRQVNSHPLRREHGHPGTPCPPSPGSQSHPHSLLVWQDHVYLEVVVPEVVVRGWGEMGTYETGFNQTFTDPHTVTALMLQHAHERAETFWN